MAVDPSRFHPLNVADTCAVWNVLSSNLFFSVALSAGCVFSCTRFVYYECLIRPRGKVANEDTELQNRFKQKMREGKITVYHLDLEDLLEVEILERRRNLGKGGLSSIAFAKRTRQAFLTDDQKARKLAEQVIESNMVQTTPHLFGWLFFSNFLIDQDKDVIVEEHTQLNRPLAKYFQEIYEKALEYRLLAHTNPDRNGTTTV